MTLRAHLFLSLVLFAGCDQEPSDRSDMAVHSGGSSEMQETLGAIRIDDVGEIAMRVTLSDLVVTVAPDQLNALLGDWGWLVGSEASPCLVTSAGDVFFADAAGAVHMLDIEEAQHERVASTMDEFKSGLRDSSTAHRWLGVDRYVRWRQTGRSLLPGQFFSFTKPLCLGGQDTVDNIDASDPVVTVSLLGQIHDQIRTLPEGTPVNEIKLR